MTDAMRKVIAGYEERAKACEAIGDMAGYFYNTDRIGELYKRATVELSEGK